MQCIVDDCLACRRDGIEAIMFSRIYVHVIVVDAVVVIIVLMIYKIQVIQRDDIVIGQIRIIVVQI